MTVVVTNIGEVPEVGKLLVTIVPDGEPLVVEVLLLNRDEGLCGRGMDAVVKLEAYPFTRYGVLRARASAEIRIGSRRVINYLWSPISRSVREAGKER